MRNIVMAGRSPSLTFKAYCHYHRLWELIYYVNGEGVLCCPNSRHPFCVADIAVIPPNIAHYEETVDGYETFIIMFENANLDPTRIHFYHDNLQSILPLMRMAHEQFYLDVPNRISICESILDLIYQYIISCNLQKREYQHSQVVSSFISELVHKFNSPDFNIRDAMSRVSYSKSYFCKLFKTETGKSPWKYLDDLRMEYARQFLEESTLSIKRIAFMSGFSDQYYFSRKFELRYGEYPLKWRTQMRKDRQEQTETKDVFNGDSIDNPYEGFTVWSD